MANNHSKNTRLQQCPAKKSGSKSCLNTFFTGDCPVKKYNDQSMILDAGCLKMLETMQAGTKITPVKPPNTIIVATNQDGDITKKIDAFLASC